MKTTRRPLALLLVVTMLLSSLAVCAFAEDSPAPEQYVFFADDFSGLKAGEFWAQSPAGYASNGTYKPQADHQIVSDNGNSLLRLSITGDNAHRAYVNINYNITGAYTAEFDYRHPQVPEGGTATDFLDVLLLGTNLRARVNYTNSGNCLIWLYSSNTALRSTSVKTSFDADTWYHIKMVVEEGHASLKCWKRDSQTEKDAVMTEFSNEALTKDLLNATHKFNITLGPINGGGVTYTADIDNIKLTKDVDLSFAESTLSGDTGEAVYPTLTGATASTLPFAVKWSSSDESVAEVNAAGRVVFGEQGTATLTAELVDAFGNPTGITRTCDVRCGSGTHWDGALEDFERFDVGADTFWKADTTNYTGFSDSYHGDPATANYSLYGIAEAGGSQALAMTASGTTRFWAVANRGLTSGYHVRMDYCPVSDEETSLAPQMVFNLFQGYTFPNSKTILCYIKDGLVRITDNTSGSNVNAFILDKEGEKLVLTPNTWYNVDLGCELGAVTMKIWPKGTEEPAMGQPGTARLETSAVTKEVIEAVKDLRINLAQPGAGYVSKALLDNMLYSREVSISLDPVEAGVDEIGTTRKIAPKVTPSGKETVNCVWSSSDESIVSVDETGTLTFNAIGVATVTARLLNADGAESSVYTRCEVTVGNVEKPLRVLSVGNSFSRDSLYYLSKLAALYGKNVEAAYLQVDSCTLRMHADNAAKNAAVYSYWVTNGEGTMVYQDKQSIAYALENRKWDIVTLQQNSDASGYPGTYNSDLDYLADYLHAYCPTAQILWNMTWTYRDGETALDTYYMGSQAVQYNAIVNCVNEKIVGNPDFDGIIPTGAAIQKARATALGDTLNRDRFHLSTKAGRLTAAMTWLKYLYPDIDLAELKAAQLDGILDNDTYEASLHDSYVNSEDNLALLRASVEAALTEAASEKGLQTIEAPETAKCSTEITVGQATAPLKLHFPDVATLSDGTTIVSAYQNILHTPTNTAGSAFASEGVGTFVYWTSKDNGQTWSETATLIDEEKMEAWGLAPSGISSKYSERYALLESNPNADYVVLADPRDPNLTVVWCDENGDGSKEEVLICTFWVRYFLSDQSCKNVGYLMQSLDGGKTWSKPQVMTTAAGAAAIKRGDLTYFNDGTILVPIYPNARALHYEWNKEQSKWVLLEDFVIPNTSSDESSTLNEVSLVAPNGGDTVFAFERESGAVLKSENRGADWTEVGNVAGLIHQPGFVQVDSSRVFATWARTTSPRTVYGQMFYVDAKWDETVPVTVYASANTSTHDMGDPSATLLANGQLMAVYYDTAYRSILATCLDPNAADLEAAELKSDLASTELSGELTDIPGSYSLGFDFTLTEQGGSVTVQTRSTVSAVITTAGITCDCGTTAELPLETGKSYTARFSTVGHMLYAKIWQTGAQEPAEWLLVCPGKVDAFTPKTDVTPSGAELRNLTTSYKIRITLQSELVVQLGNAPVQLIASVVPEDVTRVWSSSDETIATVDQNGLVTFVSDGEADITLTCGGASASCHVVVNPLSAELTGKGTKKIRFSDDYENYTVGANTFYGVLASEGYMSTTVQDDINNGNAEMSISEEDGNSYLHLIAKNSKSDWVKVDTPLTGDYTAQFDFRFLNATPSGKSQFLYITLYQDSDIHAFVHLTPDGIRMQYKEKDGATAINEPASGYVKPACGLSLNNWFTMKIARVNGALYAKVWKVGTEEPADWDQTLNQPVLDTSKESFFRFQYYITGADACAIDIDNLLLSQYTDEQEQPEEPEQPDTPEEPEIPAEPEVADYDDVKPLDWFYGDARYLRQNKFMNGIGDNLFAPEQELTRAMLATILWRAEGCPACTEAVPFPDVPAGKWFSEAIAWAYTNEIVTGYTDGTFGTEDPITREQLAVILWRSVGKPASDYSMDAFADYEKASAYAKTALRWAAEVGILKGNASGMLMPLGTATRAEAAAMVTRFCKLPG